MWMGRGLALSNRASSGIGAGSAAVVVEEDIELDEVEVEAAAAVVLARRGINCGGISSVRSTTFCKGLTASQDGFSS